MNRYSNSIEEQLTVAVRIVGLRGTWMVNSVLASFQSADYMTATCNFT